MVQHFVSGASWSGTSNRQADVYNPATGKVMANVALANASNVNEVAAVARAA